MENRTVISPGGRFKIAYLPSVLLAVPNPKSGRITLHPIRGTPDALSLTIPEILPVVPEYREETVKTIRIDLTRLISIPSIFPHGCVYVFEI
jgi:hypothetical protein